MVVNKLKRWYGFKHKTTYSKFGVFDEKNAKEKGWVHFEKWFENFWTPSSTQWKYDPTGQKPKKELENEWKRHNEEYEAKEARKKAEERSKKKRLKRPAMAGGLLAAIQNQGQNKNSKERAQGSNFQDATLDMVDTKNVKQTLKKVEEQKNAAVKAKGAERVKKVKTLDTDGTKQASETVKNMLQLKKTPSMHQKSR